MLTTHEKILWNYLRARMPRLITQFSRDPDAPTFGSWDRNFWHYKMRDFSSMILQQGMITLDVLSNYSAVDNPFYKHPGAGAWTDASLRFWAGQQLKNGSFNEYYPFEAGYPPTAFSLFAVGVIMKNRGYSSPGEEVLRSVQKAINWLLKHPEKEALNQEAAGLAGIVLCSGLPGINVDKQILEERLQQFYQAQSAEGWFPEYNGPDTGYLAVTIDCLWEIYEVSGDERAFVAMEKAIGFIGNMMSVSSEMPVMINSRNTDYLVIYGLTRMALLGNQMAEAIVKKITDRLEEPGHFLNRTDERYSVHYVYPSYFRSLPYLKQMSTNDPLLPCSNDFRHYYPDAGILINHAASSSSLYINLRKGGIVNLFSKKGITAVDYGFRIRMGTAKVAVTHWQHPSYEISSQDADTYQVSGSMTLHGWMVPSPLKHIALRGISMFFGNKLIPTLKKIMIFNLKDSGFPFSRSLGIKGGKLIIEDDISGKGIENKHIYRAPHYSLRHVSSAGQFMAEELLSVPEDNGKPEKDHIKFHREIKIEGDE